MVIAQASGLSLCWGTPCSRHSKTHLTVRRWQTVAFWARGCLFIILSCKCQTDHETLPLHAILITLTLAFCFCGVLYFFFIIVKNNLIASHDCQPLWWCLNMHFASLSSKNHISRVHNIQNPQLSGRLVTILLTHTVLNPSAHP